MTGQPPDWPDWIDEAGTIRDRAAAIISMHAHFCHGADARCSGFLATDLIMKLIGETGPKPPADAATTAATGRITAKVSADLPGLPGVPERVGPVRCPACRRATAMIAHVRIGGGGCQVWLSCSCGISRALDAEPYLTGLAAGYLTGLARALEVADQWDARAAELQSQTDQYHAGTPATCPPTPDNPRGHFDPEAAAWRDAAAALRTALAESSGWRAPGG